jgi:hypothetical protein
MAIWVDFFTEKLQGSKIVVDSNGKPYISKEIAPKEYVEIELNITQQFLPYHIYFRRYDVNGNELENRLFAQVGDRDLALKSFNDLTSKRINSFELVLDGE